MGIPKMVFDLSDLRDAAKRYAGHFQGPHESWAKIAWEGKDEPPERRLDDLVDFLGKGKALRFRGGGDAFRRIYSAWLGENRRRVESVHGRVLYRLIPADFETILQVSLSFRSHGAPPTTFGKALHFLLPETVMLWDQKVVRDTYGLGSEPKDFVAYQRFGWKLLHHVAGDRGVEILQRFEREHARSAGYPEPMTMILDHLAYSPKLSARAVNALGGHEQGFSNDS